MKKHLAVCLVPVMLLSLSSCGQKTEQKYLLQSFEQVIMETDTYKTEYLFDDQYRTSEAISYVNDEEQVRQKYEYTDTGFVMTATDGEETETMEVLTQKDAAGNVLKSEQYMDGELYASTESTFDENGKVLTRVSKNNGFTLTQTFTYDENGNELRTSFDYGDGSGTITENTYDEAGYLIVSVCTDLNGTITSRSEITYDITETDFGSTRTETALTYDAEGVLTQTQISTYNEGGEITCRQIYNADGKLNITTTYAYILVEVPIT